MKHRTTPNDAEKTKKNETTNYTNEHKFKNRREYGRVLVSADSGFQVRVPGSVFPLCALPYALCSFFDHGRLTQRQNETTACPDPSGNGHEWKIVKRQK